MSRYSAAFRPENLAGPGDARPTAMQIIFDDQLMAPALKDKVIVMTGASAGVGIETARALAATGARCFLGVRNMEKGRAACSTFLEPGRVELFQVDTSSLASVRQAAAGIRAQTARVNVMVNNAGIMAVPTRQASADGFELQLATNYLGHFLLYRLLEDLLLAGSTAAFHSRVVNVASTSHVVSGVHFDDVNLETDGAYQPYVAYGQSKTAMIYMTNQIERLRGGSGASDGGHGSRLHGLSVMPGGILSNLHKDIDPEAMAAALANSDMANFMKNEEQGAATTVLAAVGKEWEARGGQYLEDCAVAQLVEGGDWTAARGVAKHAFDEEKEKKLWEMASAMVGLA